MPMAAQEHRTVAGRRTQVLDALTAAVGPLGITELARQLDVHPNTVRFHLRALLRNGQVERFGADRRAPGRPPQLFRVARRMDPTGPRDFRLLAEVLIQDLAAGPQPAARAARAGRAWGRRQAAEVATATGAAEGVGAAPTASVGRLVALLDQLGFAPERRDDRTPGNVGLRHCPFLELAENRSEIVCPIHLGLMQGAMEQWRSPVTVDRLEPFVEPDLCLAHLTTADGS